MDVYTLRRKIILFFNEALWMREKLNHTLVNPNQMSNHHIDVQDNPCTNKSTFIKCPQEDVTILLYMSGTMFCADTSSLTQQQLEDFPRIILTSQHDWDPHSSHFPKGSHSKEEGYLFAGIAEILVDTLRSKVHETDIDPGLHDTVHDPYFIAMRIVSQVRIADAKIHDATRTHDLNEDFLKVNVKTYPIIVPSCPNKDIRMSIHMISVRYGR